MELSCGLNKSRSLLQLKHEIEESDWSKGREMDQGYLKDKILAKFDKLTHVSNYLYALQDDHSLDTYIICPPTIYKIVHIEV